MLSIFYLTVLFGATLIVYGAAKLYRLGIIGGYMESKKKKKAPNKEEFVEFVNKVREIKGINERKNGYMFLILLGTSLLGLNVLVLSTLLLFK